MASVLKVGDPAPDFSLPDETGTVRSLSGLLADGPVVLFFYPGAMTPVCTSESCHFRDLASEFSALGASRVGVSADEVSRQAQFSQKYSFDFPLLSDTDGTVARAYGVQRAHLGMLPTKRVTFVIDTNGRIIGVVRSEVRASKHADGALATLRSRAGA